MYLDDGYGVSSRLYKLGHVDIKVFQLVPLRLLRHKLGSVSYSVYASQIGRRVYSGVRRSRKCEIGQRRVSEGLAIGWSSR
jgi:hypothetical protein